MPRHRLRDAIWASLHTKLRAVSGIGKKDSERLRQFVEAVVYVLCTGVATVVLSARARPVSSLCCGVAVDVPSLGDAARASPK